MKLNGALKPRHGASCSKGSSPGAEQLRKYRDKEQQRYPRTITVKKETTTTFHKSNNNKKQHHHDVVVDDSDNDAVDDDDNDNDNDNDNDDCGVNNQENNLSEQQPQQEQQQEPLSQRSFKKCVQYSLSSKQGHFNVNHNKTVTANRITSVTAIARITSATKAAATLIACNSHGSSGKTTSAAVKENGTHDTNICNINEQGEFKKNNVDFNNNIIKLKQINITTRQITNNISKHSSQNINKHKQADKGHSVATTTTNTTTTVATKVEREQFPIANSHVTKPNKENKSNSHSNQPTTLILADRSLSCNGVTNENNNKQPFSSIYDISPILWSLTLAASLIISSFFNQFIQFWISLSCLMFSPNEYPFVGAAIGSGRDVANMRAPQSFCSKNVPKSRLRVTVIRGNTTTPRPLTSSGLCWLLVYGAAAVTLLLPQSARADDGDNFFSPNGIAIGETTTAEFDYASRGQKKFGDKCDNTLECGFPGSVCDSKKKSCRCTDDLPITNHIDKCGKGATVNESCFFNEQCESVYLQTECRDGRCVCRFDMAPIWLKDGAVECKGRGDQKTPETYIDPAMIGVLIGMALMFIIICVVLRLFSQARWHENRTIFNTPNPRLMNVSLLRESKLLHGQERRGSRMSVRAPSRQPSMASLRPHSPNPSLGKTGSRSNSHGSSASATSLRSTRSNSVSPAVNNTHHERKGSTYHPHPHHQPQAQQHQPHHHHQQQHQHEHHPQHQQHLSAPGAHQQPPTPQQPNIIANPVAESVTVEIIEPEK